MTPQDYINTKEKYNNTVRLHPQFLFRGHSNSSWTLIPSLSRIITRKGISLLKALQLERELVNKFSVSANNLIDLKNTISLSLARANSNGQLDFLGWFPLMQHFQAPTRCLDWTTSYLVALYFACQGLDTDGTVWVVDFNKATDRGMEKIGTKNFTQLLFREDSREDILMFMSTYNTNDRIESQQGKFSVCTNPFSDHETLLNEYHAIEEKIIIPKELKERILIHLYSMNINAKTLFPGLDGLGKSMAEYSELWDSTSIIN